MAIISFVKKIVLTLAVLAGLALVGGYLGLVFLGQYLTPSDSLAKSDAIVVFSGGPDRADWGVKLYQDGYAEKILFVGAAEDKSGPSNAASMRRTALNAGIPDSAILLEERSTNTLENAEFGKEILTGISAKSIILVTSPYHQRRAYETMKKVYEGEELRITNSPSGYSSWNAKAWWEKPASADITISEVMKILWAKLMGEYS